VLEAIPGHRFRRSLRLVLVLLGLLALARPAEASGCHAPERPTFGIDDSPIPASEISTSSPVHYRQAPCPGESPGLPSKVQIPQASVSTPFHHVLIILTEARAIERTELRRPFAESNPLERPPRDLSLLPFA
jgi:hypothetical protein